MAHIGPAAIPDPGVMKHITDYSIVKSSGKGEENPRRKIGLVLLNYHLPRFTPLLWDQSCLRVCADGGANRLFDELPLLFPKDDPDIVRRRHKPDVIKGDLDSIRPDVRDFYADLGTSIIDESHDQDTTDLHKCVVFIKDCTPNLDKHNLKLVVVGALGGRFDHEAANINVLHTFAKDMQIVLLSEETSLTVLPAGHMHEIHVDCSFEGPHCGLVPIGAPSLSTTSTGLRWNLNETAMAFGSLISTCNMIESDIVTVISDVYLIWTTEIRYQS